MVFVLIGYVLLVLLSVYYVMYMRSMLDALRKQEAILVESINSLNDELNMVIIERSKWGLTNLK